MLSVSMVTGYITLERVFHHQMAVMHVSVAMVWLVVHGDCVHQQVYLSKYISVSKQNI